MDGIGYDNIGLDKSGLVECCWNCAEIKMKSVTDVTERLSPLKNKHRGVEINHLSLKSWFLNQSNRIFFVNLKKDISGCPKYLAVEICFIVIFIVNKYLFLWTKGLGVIFYQESAEVYLRYWRDIDEMLMI